jgi:alpha-mannosidase
MTSIFLGDVEAQNTSPKAYKAYMVADAHLDTQWNWDVQKTIKEYIWNTLSQNLFLIGHYPDYVFNFEGGVKYSWMKEYYPIQYEQLKKCIAAGRWHIAGSSWEASDVLIASPESSIRSIMFGQNFYRKEFGTEGHDLFLPDCFGFGWTLPTIAAHCGLIGFSSQKLQWRVHPFYGNKKYPFNIGLWKGIDGSVIMMAHGYDYGKRWKNEDLSENKELLDILSESTDNTVYRYYGTGDVGGSPTIESVQSVEKGIKGNGPIKIISATSDQLYKDYLPFAKHPELPLFQGELLMDVHGTGCYTSQAAMKLYNRQNEQLGDASERAAVVADWLGVKPYPSEVLTSSWKRFIFHQFHDDLTGTSIPRAYEFSWNDELLSLKQFSKILTSSVGSVASQMNTKSRGVPLVIFNAHAYSVSDMAEIEMGTLKNPVRFKVADANGKEMESQCVIDGNGKIHLLFNPKVSACGFGIYDVISSGALKEEKPQSINTIENSVYRLTVDNNGDISSLFDKEIGKEIVKPGKSIRLALFTDNKSYDWPAWEIKKITVDADPISITGDVKVSLIESGPLRKTLSIEKKYGESCFHQYIRLYEGSRSHRIDLYNEVDWKTTNALLKAEFPLNLSNQKATYDLGIGSIQRGCNTNTAYEVYAQQWADLSASDNSYGVSILNDCKYGWDKPNDYTLRMSLIHMPSVKDGAKYQSKQDIGFHTFTYSLVVHPGALDESAVVKQAEVLNQPLYPFFTTKHAGPLGKSFSFASSDNDKVVIKMLKKAEVDDAFSLRVYETEGKKEQSANITFASDIENACEADGTEKQIGDATFVGNKLQIRVPAFGIRTYKVTLRKHKPMNTIYQTLTLPYDKKCFSYNAMRQEANFESGYSYAAELLPDSILTVDGIPFKLGNKDMANGVTCKGNIIEIPSNNTCDQIYILTASTLRDRKAIFKIGNLQMPIVVPNYTGFIGQWEHVGQNKGFLKDAEVAYVGTHRHSPTEDEPYEFTYMFKYGFNIPKGTRQIILPNDPHIVIFAATLVKGNHSESLPAIPLYRTSLKSNNLPPVEIQKENLLRHATIISSSGHVDDSQLPEFVIDGNEQTKWCDTTPNPNYIDFDLGGIKDIREWKLVNAGNESTSYITRSCLLEGRKTLNEGWKTLDSFDDNKSNVVERMFDTQKVRYIRLLIKKPTQEVGEAPSRIYEFEIY